MPNDGRALKIQVATWAIVVVLIVAAFSGGYFLSESRSEEGVEQEAYDELLADLETANAELVALEQREAALQSEYDALMAEKEAKVAALQQAADDLAALEADQNTTREELEAKYAEYNALLDDYNGTIDLLSSLGDELSSVQEAFNSTREDRDLYWDMYNQSLERLVLIDGLGRVVTIGGTPERMVSLASSVTETLFALGADELLVGRDKYSKYPPEALDLPEVGSGSALNLEALVGMEPDLVILWYFSSSAISAIEDVGITTYAVNPKSVDDVLQLIRTLGLIVGRTGAAEDLVTAMRGNITTITGITDDIAKEDRPLVYYELSTPFKTTGPGTFTNELIFMAGGVNLAAGEPVRYPILSSEYIISMDPDIIVVVSYGTPEDEIKDRDGWQNISAVRNDRVYRIDTNWVTSNPRLVLGLEQFAEWSHPDEFPGE